VEEKDGKMVITDATRIVETLHASPFDRDGRQLFLPLTSAAKARRNRRCRSARREKLADVLGRRGFLDDCIGERVEKTISIMQPGDVVLLENVRYYTKRG